MEILKTRRRRVEIRTDEGTYVCLFRSKGFSNSRVYVMKLVKFTFLNIRFVFLRRVWEHAPNNLMADILTQGTPRDLQENAGLAVREYESYQKSWDKVK